MNDKTKYSEADKIVMSKLFTLVENVNENVTLANKEITELKVNMGKNNVVLEQHHSRSKHLEGIVEKTKEALTEMIKKISSINTSVKLIDAELKPIKIHVTKIEKWTNMVLGVPMFFKVIVGILVFVSSLYGCYNVIVKLLN